MLGICSLLIEFVGTEPTKLLEETRKEARQFSCWGSYSKVCSSKDINGQRWIIPFLAYNNYVSTSFHRVIFSKLPKTLTLVSAHRVHTRPPSIAPPTQRQKLEETGYKTSP